MAHVAAKGHIHAQCLATTRGREGCHQGHPDLSSCAITWGYSISQARAALEDHVWVHGLVEAGV